MKNFIFYFPVEFCRTVKYWALPLRHAIAVYVGCICDLVISVGVLRLSYNNSVNYSWCIYCCEYCTTCRYQTTATCWECGSCGSNSDSIVSVRESSCTVLCSSLNMCLLQVSLVDRSGSMVGAHDLLWGSLLWCSQQLEWFYILGPFRHQTTCNLSFSLFSHLVHNSGFIWVHSVFFCSLASRNPNQYFILTW